jgi:hypothetical protein
MSEQQKKKRSKAWDLESTDTEALISESIYGRQPVNMGGAFHSSLFHDKKIQQLHNHNVRKFGKLTLCNDAPYLRQFYCVWYVGQLSTRLVIGTCLTTKV